MLCALTVQTLAGCKGRTYNPNSEASGKLGANQTSSASQTSSAGKSISLTAVPKWNDLPKTPLERSKAWQQIIALLQENSSEPTSAASSCEAYSQLWLNKLNTKYGYKLFYAQTAGTGTLKMADGKTLQRVKTHVFVADRELCGNKEDCDNEIIIDPTYVQFLEPGECLYGAKGDVCKNADYLNTYPKVLVGTHEEITKFYAANPKKIRLEAVSGLDPDTGKYAPESAALLLYSFKKNVSMRTNIALFQEK